MQKKKIEKEKKAATSSHLLNKNNTRGKSLEHKIATLGVHISVCNTEIIHPPEQIKKGKSFIQRD